jgi:hypothetical protein
MGKKTYEPEKPNTEKTIATICNNIVDVEKAIKRQTLVLSNLGRKIDKVQKSITGK